MEALRLYRITDQYINFLKIRDEKVRDNKNRRRPYVGVVLTVGAYKYFVPMASPKQKHQTMKPSIHFLKIDGGRLGLLCFNNMIPAPPSVLIPFDIDNDPDAKYADLLRRQVSFINRNKADIQNRAARTYFSVVNGKNKFLMSISCNFKKLERACDRFDPNHSCE